jgi:hypothetical protein
MISQTDEPVESTSMMESQGSAASADLVDAGMHYVRHSRLACQGALSLLFKASVRDIWDGLVRAGIEWEDRYTRVPAPRARG